MKENEVRVGNWVLNPMTREEFQIRPMDANICFHWPINLTDEWLLKFGFVRIWRSTDSYSIEFENGQTIALLGNTCELYGPDCCTSGQSFNLELKYVHQLQNLYFALTQTELEIK